MTLFKRWVKKNFLMSVSLPRRMTIKDIFGLEFSDLIKALDIPTIEN